MAKKKRVEKGKPKRDGTGKGEGNNAGRGGCAKPKKTRKGRNKP